jgi:uncharacterized protein involved in tolerance to divalent cations
MSVGSRQSYNSVLSEALSNARSVGYDSADYSNHYHQSSDSNSVTSEKSTKSVSHSTNSSYHKILNDHTNNKYLWKNIIKDRDEIEIILNTIDHKSYEKLANFHSQHPTSPIQDMDILNDNENDGNDKDQIEQSLPRYAFPTVTSVLPPYTFNESEKIRTSYSKGSYNSIKTSLPNQLEAGQIQLVTKQHIVQNLANEKVAFKTSVIPRDTDFSKNEHCGTDYDKLHILHREFIEQEKIRIDSYSRKAFVVSSRIRSKFEDIFSDPTFRIANLGPGGENMKLQSITRADLLDENKYIFGRFNLYGGKLVMSDDKIAMIKGWIHKIHSQLTKDWKDYSFKIKFTKTNELVIQFIKPSASASSNENDFERQSSTSPFPFPPASSTPTNQNAPPLIAPLPINYPPFPPPNNALQKYMNHLASHGIVKEYGLTKRGDRWNVLEQEFIEERGTISTRESEHSSVADSEDDEEDDEEGEEEHRKQQEEQGKRQLSNLAFLMKQSSMQQPSSRSFNDTTGNNGNNDDDNDDNENHHPSQLTSKRSKRFSLARASDQAHLVSKFFKREETRTSSSSDFGASSRSLFGTNTNDSYDGDQNPMTVGVIGGHLPPHNSISFPGMNLPYDQQHREPPSPHLVSAVLTGLGNNELTYHDNQPQDSIQQLSDDMISHHVSYLVNRMTMNQGSNPGIAAKSRSVMTNASNVSTNSTNGSIGGGGGNMMKNMNKSVSFVGNGSQDSFDGGHHVNGGNEGSSINTSLSASDSYQNSPVPNKGGGGRKSLIRASYGVSTLETMKEEMNEENSDSLADGNNPSSTQLSSNNSVQSASNPHSAGNPGQPSAIGDKNPNIYIPPTETQLYRAKSKRKDILNDENPPAEPKMLYLLTYSFYAPWVSTRQHTVNRKTAKSDRQKAHEFGIKLKKKYRIDLPSLHSSVSTAGAGKKGGKDGSLLDEYSSSYTHHSGNPLPLPLSSAGMGNSSSGHPFPSAAVSSMFGNKPNFLPKESNEYEANSINAMVYRSRQASVMSHQPVYHQPIHQASSAAMRRASKYG